MRRAPTPCPHHAGLVPCPSSPPLPPLVRGRGLPGAGSGAVHKPHTPRWTRRIPYLAPKSSRALRKVLAARGAPSRPGESRTSSAGPRGPRPCPEAGSEPAALPCPAGATQLGVHPLPGLSPPRRDRWGHRVTWHGLGAGGPGGILAWAGGSCREDALPWGRVAPGGSRALGSCQSPRTTEVGALLGLLCFSHPW